MRVDRAYWDSEKNDPVWVGEAGGGAGSVGTAAEAWTKMCDG